MKKNVYIYVCVTELLCCTIEINIVNQLHFNKINFKINKKTEVSFLSCSACGSGGQLGNPECPNSRTVRKSMKSS